MRYLSTNVSVSATAGELFIFVNTVKTLLRHVYAKFGVRTRTRPLPMHGGSDYLDLSLTQG